LYGIDAFPDLLLTAMLSSKSGSKIMFSVGLYFNQNGMEKANSQNGFLFYSLKKWY